MEKTYLGSLKIVLDHAHLHGLSKADEARVASEYTEVFRQESDTWCAEHRLGFAVEFELIRAHPGCVTVKLKAYAKLASGVIVGAGVAISGAVFKYKDYRQAVHEIAAHAAERYECKVHEEKIICKAALATSELTEALYITQEKDTLQYIVRNIWHVPKQQEKQAMRQVLKASADTFERGDPDKVRPGMLLIKPTEAMLKGIPGN